MNEFSEDFEIVNKVEKKLGLDPDEGLYYVVGTVTLSQIFIRQGAETNIAPSVGYRIAEVKKDADGNFMYTEEPIKELDDEGNEVDGVKKIPILGRSILVTKEEGVHLAARYGVRNAYIVQRDRKKKDKETGEVIAIERVTYLMPHPAREEAFTQDDRLVNVYKYNENGRFVKPLEVIVKEESCTRALWRLIEDDYARRRKNTKKKKGGKSQQQDHSRNINMLKQTLAKGEFISNPFAK
ncbi:hypothetical protein CN495_07890 [Bacillus thuringiensis]|uniref:Uncharacterized protein n=1 Tax=Bacillus thuringiensis TaxID=1428 RepID=A0ABD6S785_BACTU|nr:hypothetical protein [Bacillus thuringiensis]PER55665.1 hypothetical protein CN495_07890 [Bacillus thuringiensis]